MDEWVWQGEDNINVAYTGQINVSKWNVLEQQPRHYIESKWQNCSWQYILWYLRKEKPHLLALCKCCCVLWPDAEISNKYAFMVTNAVDIIYNSNVSFLYAVLSFLISFSYFTWKMFYKFLFCNSIVFLLSFHTTYI